MNITAIIISLIALVGAGFAFLRASSSHRILVKRIEKLKEKNTSLEQRLMRLEGASSKGNRPAADACESGRRNQPQHELQEPRQKQKERRQHEERRPQAQPPQQQQQEPSQHAPSRRKKENRRRNEPMNETNYQNIGDEQPAIGATRGHLDFQDGDLLAELEQAAGTTSPAPAPAPVAVEEYSGKRYAIIPEDGFIRQHQLQQHPDSDSYIEVDMPADGSSLTHYRFNLSGNQAFVISQGIDRLENAFSFEKPSNRKVSQVVLQQDGVLARVNNGWKIQEKARIDFR